MRHRHCTLVLASVLVAGCGSAGTTMKSVSAPSTAPTPEPKAAVRDTKPKLATRILVGDASPINVEKGKSAKFKVTVDRKDAKDELAYQGDIKLDFDASGTAGLKFEPATIPAGKDSTEVTVQAAADATGGFVEITCSAPGMTPQPIRVQATVR